MKTVRKSVFALIMCILAVTNTLAQQSPTPVLDPSQDYAWSRVKVRPGQQSNKRKAWKAQTPPTPGTPIDVDYTWFNVQAPPGLWDTPTAAPYLGASAVDFDTWNEQGAYCIEMGPLTTARYRAMATVELNRLQKPNSTQKYENYYISFWAKMAGSSLTPSDRLEASVDIGSASTVPVTISRNDSVWRRYQFLVSNVGQTAPLKLKFFLSRNKASQLMAWVDCVHWQSISDPTSADFKVIVNNPPGTVKVTWNALVYPSGVAYYAPTPEGPFEPISTTFWPVTTASNWKSQTIITEASEPAFFKVVSP